MKLITFGGALLLMLTVLHGLSPKVFSFLPLGGSAIAEIGIILGLALAIDTIWQLLRKERAQ